MFKPKFITKNPIIYKIARTVYWKIQELSEKFLGTKVQERNWGKRSGREWVVKDYWEGRDHPHRQLLMERIAKFAPLSSVLEVGCNCGPNLYLLAKKFPGIKIKGIDINPEAIKIGNELFAQEGIENVELVVGKADDINKFPDKSFDIVLTDAILIYIAPDKIEKVIKEMIRVSKKGIILLEHQDKESDGLGDYNLGSWKRNYEKLLKQFSPESQIRLIKIPDKLWPDKNWRKFGYIIEAETKQ